MSAISRVGTAIFPHIIKVKDDGFDLRWAQNYHPDIQSRCMVIVWMLDPI